MAGVKKKVCMLGSYAVGKTSLVKRFVNGVFADCYMATIGVRIDVKTIRVGGNHVDMVLWDIAGSSRETCPERTYIRGLSGYLIVGDGTRPDTCRVAMDIVHFVEDLAGPQPNILLLNKVDLAHAWSVYPDDEAQLAAAVTAVIKTSAKTGDAVERAFGSMAQLLVKEC